MNEQLIKRMFPNASKSLIEANNTGQVAQPKPSAGDAPLETKQGQKGGAGKVHIVVISRRKRLCDPDNLFAKWLIDCLRYCGAIKDDTSKEITLEVRQEKSTKEETIIELYE